MNRESRAPTRLEIPPCWKIVPPGQPTDGGVPLIVKPTAAFGSGAHPTTRLCLQALSAFAPRGGVPWRMLDFGSGTGILSLAGAKLGATVEAIEIDPLCLESSRENVALNDLDDRVRVSTDLAGIEGPFDLIVANILCDVLLAHARELTERLAPTGTLVLTGLVGTDVPRICVGFAPLLGGRQPEVYRSEEWRAVVWRMSAS